MNIYEIMKAKEQVEKPVSKPSYQEDTCDGMCEGCDCRDEEDYEEEEYTWDDISEGDMVWSEILNCFVEFIRKEGRMVYFYWNGAPCSSEPCNGYADFFDLNR
jgi:hypothetical protein